MMALTKTAVAAEVGLVSMKKTIRLWRKDIINNRGEFSMREIYSLCCS